MKHPAGSNGTAITVAERLRGARHRLDSTRMPRSCHRGERGGAAPGAHGVRRVLPSVANPSGARKDAPIPRPIAPPSAGRIVASSEVGRSAPSLRPRRGITVDPTSLSTARRTIRVVHSFSMLRRGPEPIALVKPAAHANRISAEDRASATKSEGTESSSLCSFTFCGGSPVPPQKSDSRVRPVLPRRSARDLVATY